MPALVALTILVTAGCGNNDGTNPETNPDAGRSTASGIHMGTVTPAQGYSEDGAITIGVGEQPVPDQLMHYLPQQVAATCSTRGKQPTVTIETPNGWRVTLTHGSQTVTAENPQLGFTPAIDFTTSQEDIDFYNKEEQARQHRRATASTTDSDPERGIYGDGSTETVAPPLTYNTTGLTWEKPTSGDVEIVLRHQPLPKNWPFRDDQGPSEFTLTAHVKC